MSGTEERDRLRAGKETILLNVGRGKSLWKGESLLSIKKIEKCWKKGGKMKKGISLSGRGNHKEKELYFFSREGEKENFFFPC